MGLIDKFKKLQKSSREKENTITKIVQLTEDKKYEEALKLIEKYFDVNSSADWYSKGNILNNLENVDNALICYDEAISLDPMYVKAWYRKGHCVWAQQRFVDAAKCFEKVIEIEMKKHNEDKKEEEWTPAAGFSCMLSYILEYNDYVKNEKPIPDEIYEKTNFYEDKIQEYLENNNIIPKFDNETAFIDYCAVNSNEILDKLEPNIVFEARYNKGFFHKKTDSVKVYKHKITDSDFSYSTHKDSEL